MTGARLSRLFEFPYFDHYLELAFLEYEVGRLYEGRRVFFIGGGPLPLTPIAYAILELSLRQGVFLDLTACLHSEVRDQSCRDRLSELVSGLTARGYNGSLHITSIDIQKKAASSAAVLVEKLGLAQLITVRQGDGCDVALPADTQVVVVASMAEPKQAILKNIISQIRPDRELDLVVRSVEEQNLRQLLYRPIDPEMIGALSSAYPRFQRSYSYVPPSGSRLINSFEVFRVSAAVDPTGLVQVIDPLDLAG